MPATASRRLMEGPVSYLRVGGVLSKTFAIWARNLVPFAILALLVYTPYLLYTLVTVNQQLTVESATTWDWVTMVANFVLPSLLTGAITFGVFQQLRGKPASFGSCIGVGLKRFFPVLGVSLLVVLCILGGFILLIVPGIIISYMLAVAVPVAVIENPGVMASLKRSAALTKGSKVTLFLIGLVLFAIGFVANYILRSAFISDPTIESIKMYMIVSVGVAALVMSPLSAIVSAVSYHDLRIGREGASVEELAKVFD